MQIGRKHHLLSGTQPRLPDQRIQIAIAVVRRPDLNVDCILPCSGYRLHWPVVDGVEDHTGGGIFRSNCLRCPVDQLRKRIGQLDRAPLRIPDLLGEAVGVHMDPGKAKGDGLSEFLQNMLRPAAIRRDVHIIEPPGEGHRLPVHGIHGPFRVLCKQLLCSGIDSAVGNGPDPGSLAGGDLRADRGKVGFPAHGIEIPLLRRQQHVVAVHPVIKLNHIQVHFPEKFLILFFLFIFLRKTAKKSISWSFCPAIHNIKCRVTAP